MKLSIRTRILSTYGILAVLVLVVLMLSFNRLQRIGSGLNAIQLGYLPLSKTVNTFWNYYHLDDNFDVERILANQSNRLFLESITIHSPRLMETSLRRGLVDARSAWETISTRHDLASLAKIKRSIGDLVTEHGRYTDLIKVIVDNVRAERIEEARSQNNELLAQKKVVRTQVELLSGRLDNSIRYAIRATVMEERTAAFLTIALSIGTFIVAIFIGLVAIFSLRPLEHLKRASREIAAGDLQRRVDVRTKDEVGELAQEFNRMADSIAERDEALKRQQEQLLQSEKMAVIGRMASKISHEVRNPLNALSLNIELLEDEMKGEEARQTLKAMSSEIERLNQIAENYLTIARKPKQASGTTDLKKVLTHMETIVKPECARRDIDFRLSLAESLPSLKADPSRLEQAIVNLVRNGIEAVGPGGKLSVEAQKENGAVTVKVTDNGPGIAEDTIADIFKPFYTTKEKGTGLGLAITHEIVTEQGGTIRCDSQPGEGSSFTIRFPQSSHVV